MSKLNIETATRAELQDEVLALRHELGESVGRDRLAWAEWIEARITSYGRLNARYGRNNEAGRERTAYITEAEMTARRMRSLAGRPDVSPILTTKTAGQS